MHVHWWGIIWFTAAGTILNGLHCLRPDAGVDGIVLFSRQLLFQEASVALAKFVFRGWVWFTSFGEPSASEICCQSREQGFIASSFGCLDNSDVVDYLKVWELLLWCYLLRKRNWKLGCALPPWCCIWDWVTSLKHCFFTEIFICMLSVSLLNLSLEFDFKKLNWENLQSQTK